MRLTEVPTQQVIRLPGKLAKGITDYQWLGMTPFILVHVLPFAAFWTGTRWQDWACCVALIWLRMFGVTAAYHRYFSHRTYKTSRVVQFLLAVLAQTTSQKGVLWWASRHRDHHRYSDTPRDAHSPRQFGFWYAQFGWIYDHTDQTDYSKIKDFAKYPELVVLNKLWAVPPTLVGLAVYLTLGTSGLLIGFFLSTALLWHLTFSINSVMHLLGSQRFETGDDSRNHWLLGLLMLGEGWHNNHHYFMGSTRQGFYWWEIDITYYVLKAASWVGLVWDLKEPPARVYAEAKARAVARREAQASQRAA